MIPTQRMSDNKEGATALTVIRNEMGHTKDSDQSASASGDSCCAGFGLAWKCAMVGTGVEQTVRLGGDILSKIDPEEVLVATFSREVQEGMKSGKYLLNVRRTSGETLAQAVEVGEDGRRRIKEIANLERRSLVAGEGGRDVLRDLGDVALRQQLRAIAVQLEEVGRAVARIELGLTDDRFGLVMGAMGTLRIALASGDKTLLANAIASLSEASGMVGKSLETKARSFGPVPKSAFGRFREMLLSNGYMEKKISEYEEIREYFRFYETAQQCIAFASFLLGGEEPLRAALDTRRRFLESLDLGDVATMRFLEPALCTQDDWLNHKKEYIEDTGCYLSSIVDAQPRDLLIEVTGSEHREEDDGEE